ncbi:hypothetical protein RNJ44_01193 [Nakaseomyces bracarensis]|uniref:Uncharacterized protein n=1 Tax=Nakaseomyces bracarensis TaxID=273131 RepID=A0ABR4NR59_9SACH
MIFFYNHIRSIFTHSHSTRKQIELSRRAFFQLLGFLGSCVVISLVSQSNYLE